MSPLWTEEEDDWSQNSIFCDCVTFSPIMTCKCEPDNHRRVSVLVGFGRYLQGKLFNLSYSIFKQFRMKTTPRHGFRAVHII